VAEQPPTRYPPEPLDEKAFISDCVEIGVQEHVRGRLVAAESVSAELFRGALRLASNRELNDRDTRQAFAQEVADVDRRLGVIAELATQLIPNQDPSWTTSSA